MCADSLLYISVDFGKKPQMHIAFTDLSFELSCDHGKLPDNCQLFSGVWWTIFNLRTLRALYMVDF